MPIFQNIMHRSSVDAKHIFHVMIHNIQWFINHEHYLLSFVLYMKDT